MFPHPESLTGKFLVAMPMMQDPRFAHTVILLCAHSPQGAMGLVLNRALNNLDVNNLMTQIGIAVSDTQPSLDIRMGGPVEPRRGLMLYRNATPPRAALPSQARTGGNTTILGDIVLTPELQTLEKIAQGGGPRPAFLAFGYAGWGGGQLETEIRANVWLVCDAVPELIFDRRHHDKWTRALRAQGIKDPGLLSSQAGHA